MTSTIFGADTPVQPNNDAGAPGITVATRAQALVDGDGEVRWFSSSTAPSAAVWNVVEYNPATDGPGAPVANGSFPGPIAAGAWNYAGVTFPVTAGTQYVVEVWNSEGRYASTQHYFDTDRSAGDGQLVGKAGEPGSVPVRENGRFNQGGSITYPSLGFNNSGYFVDVVLTPTVAPAEATAAVVSGATMTGSAAYTGTASAGVVAGMSMTGTATPPLAEGWYPSPNPGGDHRRLMRNAIAEWIRSQRIQGLEKVSATQPGPDRIDWSDATFSAGQFHAQTTLALPSDSEDFLAGTGPTDPGGKLIHYEAELYVWHLGGEPDSWEASEDDYDRIVDRLKDCLRGAGRDMGRPDVILQAGVYPRTAGIRGEHEDPVSSDSGIFRRGTIFFTVTQYLASPLDQ